ncbi:hypothetical protein EMIT0P44_450020 [Pseudomonas sp. IT-P44]
MSGEKQKQTRFPVGARLAREKRPDGAFIQTARVIVDTYSPGNPWAILLPTEVSTE